MVQNTKLFLSQEDKANVYVAFPKNEILNRCIEGNPKYYLIVMYLRKHVQTFGDVYFTLYELLNECGFSTKSHNENMYGDFRKIIKEEIIDKGYAISKDNIMTVKPNSLYRMRITNSKLFISNNIYVEITIDEFEKITQVKDVHINRSTLFIVYLYIKQFIYIELNTDYISKFAYPSKNKMIKTLGMSSKTTLEKAISILEDIGLIYVQRNIFVQDKNDESKFVPARNVYALRNKDLDKKVIVMELEIMYGRKVVIKDEK